MTAENCISGLKIEDGTLGYLGLLGYLGKGGCVRNVRLTNVSISVSDSEKNTYAGALVAFMQNDSSGGTVSVIDNCHVSGSISVATKDKFAMVGGLIGMSNQYAAVTNCGADVAVSVSTGAKNGTVGGLVGMASVKPLLMNCHSLGDVRLATSNASYHYVGGLFGQANGIVYNCYSGGNVTLEPQNGASFTSNLAAGIAGAYGASCYADSCYYSADVTVSGNGAGKFNPDTVLKKSAGELASEEFAALLHDNLSPASLAAATERVSAANIDGCSDFNALISRVDGKFYDWALSAGTVALTGELWASDEVNSSIFASGSGTQEAPYIIKTAEQLRAFAASLSNKLDYSGSFIALGADIDLSGEEWTPVGGSDWAFNGSFDGGGYSISGLKVGSEQSPRRLDSESPYIGLFGVLGQDAVIRDVRLTDVSIYTQVNKISAYVGGIVGYMAGGSGGNSGAVLDGCSVSGTISHRADAVSGVLGNQFVGGLAAMQYKGAIINSCTAAELSCVANGEALAEIGGLVGLNNRGLIANCYSRSNAYGSGSRANGLEGMAVVSPLVAVEAGELVNCYSSGNTRTKEYSVYVGMVSGWVTGIGKSYTCWYDLDSTMYIGEDDVKQNVNPVEPIGTKVPSGVSDEGDAYTGGLVDAMSAYNAAGYPAIAEAMNASFKAFPVDITKYGLAENALRSWNYDADKKLVTFAEGFGNVTYVQPDCEKVVPVDPVMQDGEWYGRDVDEECVVKLTVSGGKSGAVEVVSGPASGEKYEAAVERAKYKATYGDFSHYEAADTSRFAGGAGTEADPYLIGSEEQLRYLSYSVNEDVDWSGVYFKQTADISLSSEWQPIGWALCGEVNGAMKIICAYPFRGNYDGGDYSISGLRLGTADQPTDMLTLGLFGLTSGTLNTNSQPSAEDQTVTLKNIHLKDVSICGSARYEFYAGGLLGNGQYGIYVDNCSVEGKIEASASERTNRLGGLIGSAVRGSVTNCWTDVEIVGETDAGHVYAGGLYGLDNRITTLNCYTLGSVSGSSANNNKVHIGGLSGQGGGVCINCYAAGDIVSQKTTTDLGGIAGRAGGIAAHYNCYYNSEASQKQGDTQNSPAVAVGVNANNKALIENVTDKTAAELRSADFAALLNENIKSLDNALADVNDFLGSLDLAHLNYYQGNELRAWALRAGVVTFGADEQKEDEDDNKNSGGIDIPAPVYSVSAADTKNGSVTALPANAAAGTRVRLTVTPESGYVLDTIKVTDADGRAVPLTRNADGSYSFTMPSGGVKVEASFKAEKQSAAPGFADVPADAYYAAAVAWAVENGITNGTEDNSFSPNAACTRAQIVTFLWRAAGSPRVSGENPFTDVSAGDYYYDAVLWAVKNGVTNGVSDTQFGTNAPCTRAQALTLQWRAAGKPPASAASFKDVPPDAYFAAAVAWAVENEITNGTANNTFSPHTPCTRAQIVTFLWREAQ